MNTSFFSPVFIFCILAFTILNIPLCIINYISSKKNPIRENVIIRNIFVYLVLPSIAIINSLAVSFMGMYSTDNESIAFLEGAMGFTYIVWAVLSALFWKFIDKLVHKKSLFVVITSFFIGEISFCLIPFFGALAYMCSIVVLPSFFLYYFLLKEIIVKEYIKKYLAVIVLVFICGALVVSFVNGDSIQKELYVWIGGFLSGSLLISSLIVLIGIRRLLNKNLHP